MKKVFFFCFIFLFHFEGFSQPFCKDALKENRDKLYRDLVNRAITKNLSLPLSDSTEENWQDAFAALELINYHSGVVRGKISFAMNDITNRSISFQQTLLELVYANYPDSFYSQTKHLLQKTTDTKIFVMCAVYMLKTSKAKREKNTLVEDTNNKLSVYPEDPLLQQLFYQLNAGDKIPVPAIHTFFEKDYLAGNILMISLQRKNRNYPGLVIIRDKEGNFIKDINGNLFSVPQLARSLSGMPGYISNGNTPEGIFRMDGFDSSRLAFIGPTTNIQLTMPFENNAAHFYKDSSLITAGWDISAYKKLLPKNFQAYYPAHQAYYAGKAGRTAIIAHGTTVDPLYYKEQPYYPLIPTEGCLCTKEIWSPVNGKLLESDQWALVNAVMAAGGPDGYCIVINIDDRQAPVSLDEILPFLKSAGQK